MSNAADSYNWWIDKPIQVLIVDGWVDARVVGVVREPGARFATGAGVLGDQSVDTSQSDGVIDIALIASRRRVHVPIYPMTARGLVPNVVLAAPHHPDLDAWWQAMSPDCRTALQTYPDDPIPGHLLREVLQAGGRAVNVSWPATLSGADGVRLIGAFADRAMDEHLRIAYELAEKALDDFDDEHPTLTAHEPVLRSDFIPTHWGLLDVRNRAKIEFDTHRAVMASF